MAHDERDKTLNKIGHNMEYEIFFKACGKCVKEGGSDFQCLAVSKSLADGYAQDCIEECPYGKCKAKVVKYQGN